jgi:hypothetical protein
MIKKIVISLTLISIVLFIYLLTNRQRDLDNNSLNILVKEFETFEISIPDASQIPEYPHVLNPDSLKNIRMIGYSVIEKNSLFNFFDSSNLVVYKFRFRAYIKGSEKVKLIFTNNFKSPVLSCSSCDKDNLENITEFKIIIE